MSGTYANLNMKLNTHEVAAGRSRLVGCNRLLGVIPLAADCPGEGTKDVIAAPQAVQDVAEVETRLPREFLPSAIIDIDTINTREHSPTSLTYTSS